MIKYRIFIDEELETILCEIQLVLIRRPLTSIANKTSDFELLARNHLLIRNPSPNQSPGHFREHEINLRRKGQSVQAELKPTRTFQINPVMESSSHLV